jgi:hypothetical protein
MTEWEVILLKNKEGRVTVRSASRSRKGNTVFDVEDGLIDYSLPHYRCHQGTSFGYCAHRRSISSRSSGFSEEAKAAELQDQDCGSIPVPNGFFDDSFFDCNDPFSQNEMNSVTFGDDDSRFYF